MEVCNCSMFCCALLCVHFSIAIISMGKRELIALLNLSSWCLVVVGRLFLAVLLGCLQFVIVVYPDHTHLLFFTRSEKNYSVFKLAFLASKWAVTENFSDYLMNTELIVYTESNSFTYILTSAKLDATGQRWASAFGQFNFKVIYRSGLNNKDADAMSRYPFIKTI